MTQETKQHWAAIDFAKGILLIFVFLGHMIPGVRRDTFSRYVIYAFHMPLFFGISGFLFRIEKMDLRIRTLAVKYWNRMILPWIIAVVFFYVSLTKEVTLASFIKAFWYPYYHLWYIPGFLCYILIVLCLWKPVQKTRFRWGVLLAGTLLITIISRFKLIRHISSVYYVKRLIDIAAYDFRLYNLFFFPLGMWIRHLYDNRKTILPGKTSVFAGLASCLSVAVTVVLYWFHYTQWERAMYLIANTFLLFSLSDLLMKQKVPRNPVLEFLGRYSLPVYLYHVEGKNLASRLAKKGSLPYYLYGTLFCIVICLLIWVLRKIPAVDRIVFGSSKPKTRGNEKA